MDERKANHSSWPKRVFFGTAGAAVAGMPLLSGGCPGACTSCLRCVAGASGLLVLLAGGSLVRRMRTRQVEK